MTKFEAFNVIDNKKQVFFDVSEQLWENPETSMLEFRSAKILVTALKNAGFEVKTGIGGIETAFEARYGSGHPIIGLLGEYDALAGMSQCSDKYQKEPLSEGAAGHGCGHNLLGAGTFAAAVAIKAYLQDSQLPGTVIYYGCPGEESSSCKAFMAKDGVFDELDCALAWHPAGISYITTGATLANCRIFYRFSGRASHAASAPEHGRSALDAVELMNVGVQFLREHVDSSARMHYAITDAGGKSPNIVQDHAEVLYLLRAPKDAMLTDIIQRVDAIAEGAALMTGTKMERQFVKACASLVPNTVVGRQMQANAEGIPFPEITDEEFSVAKQYQDTLQGTSPEIDGYLPLYSEATKKQLIQYRDNVINDFILPYADFEVQTMGSTDVGDISKVCPTAMIWLTTLAANTPAHSWQMVAQGKNSLSHKMMLHAGKILAGTAIDMIENPNLVAAAKKEYDEKIGSYQTLIPDGIRPIPM